MGEINLPKLKTFKILPYLLFVVALVPPLFKNEYLNSVLISIFLWAAIGASFDLTAGFIRVTNFGYAGFFAIGAYTSGLLALYFNISPWIGVFPAVAFAAALGALVGLLTLRLHGIYAAVFSWFLAETIKYILAAASDITRGYQGLMNPPLFPGISRFPYYYFILGILAFEIIILTKIARGKMGFAFRVIGEDETAAKSIGVNVLYYKVSAFTISTAFAGLLGVFYAHYIGVITPDVSSLAITVPALAICYVGGAGSIWGSIPSSFVIITIFEAFREIGAYRFIIYGVLLIVVMIWARTGLVGLIRKAAEKMKVTEKEK